MKKIFMIASVLVLFCIGASAQNDNTPKDTAKGVEVTIPLKWDVGVSLPFLFREQAFEQELNTETNQVDTTDTAHKSFQFWLTVADKDSTGYEIQISFSDVEQEIFDEKMYFVLYALNNQTVKFRTNEYGKATEYLNIDEVMSNGLKTLRPRFNELYNGALAEKMITDTLAAPREDFIKEMTEKYFTQNLISRIIAVLYTPFTEYTEYTLNTAQKYHDSDYYKSVVNPADTVEIRKYIILDGSHLDNNLVTVIVRCVAEDTDAMAWTNWQMSQEELEKYLQTNHFISGEYIEYIYNTETGMLYKYVFQASDLEELKENKQMTFFNYHRFSIQLDYDTLWGVEGEDDEEEEDE